MKKCDICEEKATMIFHRNSGGKTYYCTKHHQKYVIKIK